MISKLKKKDILHNMNTDEDEDDDLDLEMADHINKFMQYYEPGALVYEKHKAFVMNLKFYAERSGIPIHFLYHTSEGILTKKDYNYLDILFSKSDPKVSGAIFYGDDGTNMERMYSMAGLFLRNFKDAKLIMAQELLKLLKKGDDVENTVVFVPNFCLHKESGGDVSTWDTATLLGWVLGRHGNGRHTILYSDTRNLIRDKFGNVLKNHIETNFKELNKNKG